MDSIYIDFEKAFDKVCHTLLVQKLIQLNIDPSWILWINSYISKRKFYVKLYNHISNSVTMTSGIPQGSNMGPILFLIYINALPSVITNSKILILADDCKIFKAINDPNDSLNLQNDLNSLCIWSKLNHLPFNADKCLVIHYSKKKTKTLLF